MYRHVQFMDADNVPLSCAEAKEGGYRRAVVAEYLMKDIGATATCCGTAAEWRAVWISYSVGGAGGGCRVWAEKRRMGSLAGCARLYGAEQVSDVACHNISEYTRP